MKAYLAHISIVLVHLLNISVYNLEGDEFVVGRVAAGNEEEGGITSIHNLRICPEGINQHCVFPLQHNKTIPLYSKKLHILVRRASTS